MKGIVLAGGSGTRLHPLTYAVSKQLMPVYDKPMIYYPISTLMKAGINEILIITTLADNSAFKQLLGDGSELGCFFKYAIQEIPNGLAQAFVIGKEFVGTDSVALVLGDNIFYGSAFESGLEGSLKNISGATIFAYKVSHPEQYGVVEFDENNIATKIIEKPKYPKSNYAVPGLYFYDNQVLKIAANIKPSDRGEYEITDVNRIYLKKKQLKVSIIDKGTAWLDTGTFNSLMQASQFVYIINQRQGVNVGCIEETAYRKGFINKNQLKKLATKMLKSGYGEYLLNIVNHE